MIDWEYVRSKGLKDLESLAWFTEYSDPKSKRRFVLQSHRVGNAEHFDLRLEKDGYLDGLSIVGFSVDQPATVDKLLEKGRGFRAEPKCSQSECTDHLFNVECVDGEFYVSVKDHSLSTITELARQPKVWLFWDKDIGDTIEFKPKEVGAGVEKAGTITILDKGTWWDGAIKPYFKEFFLNGTKLKNYVRCVVTAVKVPIVDPQTKQPTGRYERMWRFMIPVDQTPYAVSKRARDKKWKPPKGVIPIPPNWIKEHKEEFEKWLEWVKGSEEEESLTKGRFAIGLSSWMGARAVSGRRMPQFRQYLLIDDGRDTVRTFLVDGNLLRDTFVSLFEMRRSSKKWMTYEGKTDPDSRFNPNKELVGEYRILDSGSCSFNVEKVDGSELIRIRFNGKILKGDWEILQDEAGSDIYTIEKLNGVELDQHEFVLHEHVIRDKPHWDIRIRLSSDKAVEFNLYSNPLEAKLEEPIRAVKKYCYDPDLWMIKSGTGIHRKVGRLDTIVNVLDSGSVNIIEDTDQFMSMDFKGSKLKGYYILKVDSPYVFMKSRLPTLSLVDLDADGDPRTGKYFDPFRIIDVKGRPTFTVELYDLRMFTRCESDQKVKRYLDIDIPEGVKVGICLYRVPRRIHHARVAYVRFDRDKWSYQDAESWIRKNKLHTWSKPMIRE